MMQEFLKAFSFLCGVSEEQSETRILSDAEKAKETLAAKVDSQKGQLLKTLQNIAANSRVRSNEGDPLLLPYYLAILICKTPVDQLRDGIEMSRLLQLLRDVHHRDDKDTVRTGDVTNLLTRLPTIQKGIQPPFLYYDSNNRRLRIVDTRYFFVLSLLIAPACQAATTACRSWLVIPCKLKSVAVRAPTRRHPSRHTLTSLFRF